MAPSVLPAPRSQSLSIPVNVEVCNKFFSEMSVDTTASHSQPIPKADLIADARSMPRSCSFPVTVPVEVVKVHSKSNTQGIPDPSTIAQQPYCLLPQNSIGYNSLLSSHTHSESWGTLTLGTNAPNLLPAEAIVSAPGDDNLPGLEQYSTIFSSAAPSPITTGCATNKQATPAFDWQFASPPTADRRGQGRARRSHAWCC